MALAETSSSLQPYVYFTRAYPTMPISPTYVAAGYPLSKPFVNEIPSPCTASGELARNLNCRAV